MGNAYRSVLALNPTGDAVPANVLAGKTFSNADGTGKTGTMANNGAVSITLTDQDPTYTIPEGYHNGSGVVGFSASGGDGADLIVTCSSNFAGATISCTDGTTTYQQICPSTAPFEVVFESIPVGTWTISGTAEGTLFSTQFTVVDFETVLNPIPEGSTVIPTDDIQTWLHCANIWDKNYTTISQVLADASTLQALIASNNAADYMARSTTWASSVTSNQSAMSYIGLNDYCADTLLADSTWTDAICNSTYFESVLNVKVPTMTSNTTPSGEVSANYARTDYEAYRAFNGNDNSNGWMGHYASGATMVDDYITYDFGSKVYISKVRAFLYRSAGNVSADMTFEIFGSNDSNSFVEIGTVGITSTNVQAFANFAKGNGYRYIRALVKSNVSGVIGNGVKLQFYGRASS